MTDSIQYQTVNGADLAFQVHGAGQGRPDLLFVHGYAMRSTGPVYRKLLALLAEHFTVHALDLRGHGGSASQTHGWSMEAWADDVAAFAVARGLERPHYVGHSNGGVTGQYAALRHPGVFSTLSLLTTAPATGGGFNPPETATAIIEASRDRAVMSDFFGGMYVRAPQTEIDHALDAIAVMDPSIHKAYFPGFAALDFSARLSEITTPALFLNGLRDNVVPPADQHFNAMGLPFAKEVVFSTEGHMLPIEAPELTAREILTFIRHDAPGVLAG